MWNERKMGHDNAERTYAVEVVMHEEMTETVEHNRKDMKTSQESILVNAGCNHHNTMFNTGSQSVSKDITLAKDNHEHRAGRNDHSNPSKSRVSSYK